MPKTRRPPPAKPRVPAKHGAPARPPANRVPAKRSAPASAFAKPPPKRSAPATPPTKRSAPAKPSATRGAFATPPVPAKRRPPTALARTRTRRRPAGLPPAVREVPDLQDPGRDVLRDPVLDRQDSVRGTPGLQDPIRTREIELIEALRRDPDDLEPYLVLADLLQAASDPRGELIAIQRALVDAPTDALLAAERALLARDTLLGPRVTEAIAAVGDGVQLRWRFGFVDDVRVVVDGKGAAVEELLRALFAAPAVQLLRSLYLQITMRQVAPIIRALAEAGVPSLRVLRILSREDSVGDLSPVWRRLPRLRHVKIGNWSGFDLGTLELPELADLELVGPSKRELDTILARPRPALRRLHLDILTPTPTHAVEALFSGAIPSLRDLGVQLNDGPIELETLPPALEALALESMVASSLRVIVANGRALRSLRLRMSGSPAAASLKAILDGKRLPALRDLYLAPTTARIRELAKAGVLGRLESLVLSSVDGDDLQALLDAAPAFAHLRRLTLLGTQAFDRTREKTRYRNLQHRLPMLVEVASDRLISGDLEPGISLA